MISNTSYAAARAFVKFPANGAALPNENTAEVILKKTRRIPPTVYSGSIPSPELCVNVHPYLYSKISKI